MTQITISVHSAIYLFAREGCLQESLTAAQCPNSHRMGRLSSPSCNKHFLNSKHPSSRIQRKTSTNDNNKKLEASY